MYAITLYEPWASLILQGVKEVETRSWRFPDRLHGERIAIHAARRWTWREQLVANQFVRDGVLDWPMDWTQPGGQPLTLGKVVCTAVLHSQERTEWCRKCWPADTEEFRYGDYGPYRWAWFLINRESVTPPKPATGRQGFWTWNKGT